MSASMPSSQPSFSSQASVSQSTSKFRANKKGPSLRRPQAVVKLIIGPERETFYVHKDMICHHSSFFAAAFNNSKYAESDTQTMYLPDVLGEDFGAFVQWLYEQRIELDTSNRDANILPLARLWILAQRFKIGKLQNKVMDKLRPLTEAAEKDVLKGFLSFVYEGTQDNVELRRLAADRMAWATTQQGLGAWVKGGHLPVEMLGDIVLALKRDHVPGKTTVKHYFGEAREYYVDLAEGKREDGEES